MDNPSGVFCPSCGAALSVIPDSYPLWLSCEAEHFFTISELLERQLPEMRETLEHVLDLWKERADILSRIAWEAMRNNHPLIAQSFQESNRKIEARIRKVRELLSQVDPLQRQGR